jgi:hypothetical protein
MRRQAADCGVEAHWAGHDVWFGKTHGVITHGTTGQSTVFAKKNGVYVLKVWAPRPAVARAPLSGGTGQ